MTAVFLRRGRCGFQNYLLSVKIKKIGKGYLILPFDRCCMPNKESGRGSLFIIR